MKQRLFTLLFILFVSYSWAYSEIVEVDGICYYIYETDNTASVTSCENKYHGHVVIPSSISCSGGMEYLVTSIGFWAFEDCSGLTSIEIPSSVTSIYSSAFSGCSGLTSIEIPSSVISIGTSAFSGCSNLKSIEVEEGNPKYTSVDGILYSKDKTMLIRYPSCHSSANFVIPNSVTTIEYGAFEGCSSISSMRIPESVEKLSGYAFLNCNSLQEIIILSPSLKDKLEMQYYTGTLYAYYSVFYKGNLPNCKHVELTNPYFVIDDVHYLRTGIKFQVKDIRDENAKDKALSEILYGYPTQTPVKLMPDENGIYTITDWDWSKNLRAYMNVHIGKTEQKQYSQSFSCNYESEKVLKCFSHEFKQTSAQFDVSVIPFDDVEELGVRIDGKDYKVENLIPAVNGGCKGTIEVSGLIPNRSYMFCPYAIFEDGFRLNGSYSNFKTSGFGLSIKNETTPTTLECTGLYLMGEAHFKSCEFKFEGKIIEGGSMYITGLEPNKAYTITFSVKSEEGDATDSKSISVTMPKLELNTLQPKCVSNTCAIVAAATNISEDEKNVGFQWRKYDAPESLKPSEGFAAIYDGQLEGYIRNLQSSSYYNVRAFYKSEAGVYYYGDWVTFDPSDFSYFEPTVHTYQATEIGHNSAKVKGYVLAGTDEIKEQGFQYWSVGENESHARFAYTNAKSDISTILSTGQVMEVVLVDLLPETTYHFRSFVTTSSGNIYGEEQTFITSASPTGIDSVETDGFTPIVIGYYDLSGRKYKEPQKGLNIIRYSNGTARKIFVR